MEFEEIDRVTGDVIAEGDIVQVKDEFHQIHRVANDTLDAVYFDTYNLSTGDEDGITLYPAYSYSIFRSY